MAVPAGAVRRRGYFEVIGRESGKPYRLFPGGLANVCEVDERGRPRLGLCFRTLGELPIGDVMLAQKIALESSESSVLAVARRFELNRFMFRRSRLLG